MADDEPEIDTTPTDADAPVDAADVPMDVETALKVVLKNALVHDGLARGLKESVQALERSEAQLCVLSSGCNEPEYVKLVEALCAEHEVNLMKVSDSTQLGEWVGLAKLNQEGEATKVVKCSCSVIKDFGEESQALSILQESFKK